MVDLRLSRVDFTYPDGMSALRNITLEVNRGERVAIVGPNGAGKSTLLNLMAALDLPGEGTLEIMGERVTRRTADRLRGSVGLLFQDPDDQIFMPTVWDDVAFGPVNMGLDENEVGKRVRESLALAGLQGYEKRVPHHLSFGEKKRVAIAGVLAMRPPILLLDEPTANLDPRGRLELLHILRSLEQTVILATHDLSVAFELARRAVVLKKEILFDGDFRELVERNEVLREANLELPPLTRVFRRVREIKGETFGLPLTVEEAVDLLSRGDG